MVVFQYEIDVAVKGPLLFEHLTSALSEAPRGLTFTCTSNGAVRIGIRLRGEGAVAYGRKLEAVLDGHVTWLRRDYDVPECCGHGGNVAETA